MENTTEIQTVVKSNNTGKTVVKKIGSFLIGGGICYFIYEDYEKFKQSNSTESYIDNRKEKLHKIFNSLKNGISTFENFLNL